MWMSKEQKARLTAYRAAMDAAVESVRENTAALNKVAVMARPWTPGAYAVGDVRVYGGIPYRCVQAHDSSANPGVPYRCVQAHDSSANPGWTPDATPALWIQYHGTTPETARPWVAPAGAHDIYRAGEYMIWTDGQMYKCLQDTNFSPTEYAQAWEAV